MSAIWNARLDALMTLFRREREGPLTAIELANFCGIVELRYSPEMQRETKRRRVRELIAELRGQGQRICAGVRRIGPIGPMGPMTEEVELGYWLARSDEEWHEYLESRKANARFEFAMVKEMGKAARERTMGQGTLFRQQGNKATRQENEAWARV